MQINLFPGQRSRPNRLIVRCHMARWAGTSSQGRPQIAAEAARLRLGGALSDSIKCTHGLL